MYSEWAVSVTSCYKNAVLQTNPNGPWRWTFILPLYLVGFLGLRMNIGWRHLGLPTNLCSVVGFLAALLLWCRLIYKPGIDVISASLVWPQSGQPSQWGSAPLVLCPPAGQSKFVLIARAMLPEPPRTTTWAISKCTCIRHANNLLAKPSHVVIPPE